MKTKRIVLSIGIFIISAVLLILLNFIPSPDFVCTILFDQDDTCQIYEGTVNASFADNYSASYPITAGEMIDIAYPWNHNLAQMRIDLGDKQQLCKVSGIGLKLYNIFIPITSQELLYFNGITILQEDSGNYLIQISDIDPYMIFSTEGAYELYCDKIQPYLWGGITVISFAAALIVFLQYAHSKILIFWALDILKNFKLILDLAGSDFKTKYAASYLGIVWAFIQPIVTISIYVIVFGYGFKSTPVKDFPFVLWLSAGIIPWLFFSEALMSATTSLKEYSFLVKKVVFEVKILPLVKIMAAFYIHLVFIGIVIVLYAINGYRPGIYDLQILYYAFCTLVISLGIGYITSALNVFIPDLIQIVNIILQFGMWMTPIMWSPSLFGVAIERIIKINPLYYIVEGYRDCFYNHIPFWEKPGLTLYFWIVALVLLVVGMYTFRKLERHFADVL